MNASMSRPVRALALLLACGGGMTGPGCSGGGGGEGDGTGPALDGGPTLPARYVSMLDSSATANAVAAGVDPRHEFLADTFACHDEVDVDLSVPDLEVWFSGDGRYATPDGEGRIGLDEGEEAPSRDYRFRGGPLDDRRVFLGFDDFGQSFGLDANGAEYRCYQNGASAARAQVLARLATPRAGEYRCRAAGGGDGEALLGLGADGTYAVDGERGAWTLSDVVGNTSGRMSFSGGPLDGESGRYAEERDNGYRSFDVRTTRSFGPLGLGGAGSELSLTCESLGPPVTLPLYGPAAAPVLTPPGAGPAGFWWHDDILTSPNDSHLEIGYLLVRSDGYAYAGTPPVTGIDCTRTRPNGLPFCDAWTFDGEELLLYRPYGEPTGHALGFEGGSLASVDGDAVRAVAPPGAAALVGDRENVAYSQSGCVGLGYCSYSYTERALNLAADGRFLAGSSSNGGTSIDASSYGGVSTCAVGSASASNIGRWSVTGNVLELAYDSGRTVHRVVVESGGTIGVDDLMYLRATPDAD